MFTIACNSILPHCYLLSSLELSRLYYVFYSYLTGVKPCYYSTFCRTYIMLILEREIAINDVRRRFSGNVIELEKKLNDYVGRKSEHNDK